MKNSWKYVSSEDHFAFTGMPRALYVHTESLFAKIRYGAWQRQSSLWVNVENTTFENDTSKSNRIRGKWSELRYTYKSVVYNSFPIGLTRVPIVFRNGIKRYGPKTNTRGKYNAWSFPFLFYTHLFIFITIIIIVIIIFNPAPTPANKRAGQVDDKIITSHTHTRRSHGSESPADFAPVYKCGHTHTRALTCITAVSK